MAGTGRCVYNEIVAESLTKENCEYWFKCVRNYLIARDLWDVVDGTIATPPEDEDHKEDFVTWRKKNAAALHVILISCGTHSFSQISHVCEAKLAWNILNDNYRHHPPEPESDQGPEPEPEPEPEPTPDLDPEQEPEPKPDQEPESEPALPPETVSEPSPLVLRREEVDFDVAALYKAIYDNKWNTIKAIIDEHPSALTARLTYFDQTALHVAAEMGHVGIVEELVRLVPPEHLELLDNEGYTPLATAAYTGAVTPVVECMLNKNRNALGIPIPSMSLPVSLAFCNGHKKLGRYLYSLTPLEFLQPHKGTQGPKLLRYCFITGQLDIALDLLQRCKDLLSARDNREQIPILRIAAMSFAFSRGSQLVFWKRWIYNYINIQPVTTTDFVRVDIQQQGESYRVKGRGLLRRFISNAYNLLGMKEIYEAKLVHAQAAQILSLLSENVDFLMKETEGVAYALFDAAREGNVEFVEKISKAYPLLLLIGTTDTNWNTFSYAVEYRQAEIFNLIHGHRFKDRLASSVDDSGNTLLHVAGKLAPSSKLNRISGPALQMQAELQWFKEVESVVPPEFRVYKNTNGMKPEEIFKESHKELRKEGEKWMKDTASSCSVVGALVVTIMFAAAFTVPGGNNQEFGYPIFLDKENKLFMLFIISDALSLFSSTTSVLMFLGILTSRYAEEDFLKSLPTKLIIGLSALFLSIATMIIAFSACILIMLRHSYSWSLLPVIMLASVPVTIFVLLQFPLLVHIVSSTYGPGIFSKKVELRL